MLIIKRNYVRLNINDTDGDGRRKAVDLLKEGIDEAYEMGAVGFAFLSGKYEADKMEEAYQALVNLAWAKL